MNTRSRSLALAALTSLVSACPGRGISDDSGMPNMDVAMADTADAAPNDVFLREVSADALDADASIAPDVVADATMDGTVDSLTDVPRDVFDAPPAPVRAIAPLSTSRTTTRRPTLRWQLGDGNDGAHVDVCADRACTTVEQAQDVTGTQTTLSTDLAPGVHYWRLFARMGTSTSSTATPTWEFFVGRRSAGVDTSWGTVPDFNGDGRPDALAGAPGAGSGAGRGYVFHGTPTGFAATPSAQFAGAAGAHLGHVIASGGDVNGDGFADLIVAAPGGMTVAGFVQVFFGAASGLSATPSVTLPAPADGRPSFAASAASAGDVNGDGYADLIVGEVGMMMMPGRAYVYFGGPNGPGAIADVSLSSPMNMGGRFGSSVASAGDVNGDGLADLIVGGSRVGHPGFAHVFLGSLTSPATLLPMTRTSTTMDASFGAYVSGECDVDGDGRSDVLVGEPGAGSMAGTVLVFTGNATGIAATATATITAPGAMGEFGAAVVCAGDVNGDGFDDVMVGADLESASAGRAYVYAGSALGLVTATPLATIDPLDGAGGLFGRAMSAIADVNRDGFDDVLIGAPGAMMGVGRVYVLAGRATGVASAPAFTWTGSDGSAAQFGFSVGPQNTSF